VRRFLGHHIAYVDAQLLSGVAVAPASLAMVLIDDNELLAVKTFSGWIRQDKPRIFAGHRNGTMMFILDMGRGGTRRSAITY